MKEMLRKLLAEGKIKPVFAQLRQAAQQDADWQNDIVLLSGRFATMERQNRQGTADPATLNIERSKIIAALLEMIEQLEPANPPATTPNPPVEGNKATKSIIQNADKIYNIEHIDNANFS
jgi:hypothetical protein